MENPCPVKFFEDALSDVILELQDLLIRKQKDYGHKNISEFGEYGILVRSNDKLARLKNLMGKTEEVGVPQNEPIVDSWTDLAGYAILALMWRRGVFLLPLKPLPEQRGQTPGGISGVGSGSTVGLGW